jgi:quercetin dioxygenase-like cupin family protein
LFHLKIVSVQKIVYLLVVLVISFGAKAEYNKEIVLEQIIKTDTTSIGQKIVYPQFQDDEVTIMRVTIPPGKSTGWHKHSFPVFAYVQEGVLTVEVENKKTMHFMPNSSFSEVIDVKHNGINNGKVNVVLIAFFMGEKGKSLSEH